MANKTEEHCRSHHPQRRGMILPAVSEIKSLLTNDTALPMMIAAFGETLANNISFHYERYYTHKHILLASILEPRFKTEWVIRDESVCNRLGDICDLFVGETEQLITPCGTPDTTPHLALSLNQKGLDCLVHTSASSCAHLETPNVRLKSSFNPRGRTQTQTQMTHSLGTKTPSHIPIWPKYLALSSASLVALQVPRGCFLLPAWCPDLFS